MNLKPQDVIYFDKLQRDYENTINYYNDLAEHMESWRGSLKNNEHFMNERSLDNDIKNVLADDKNKITKEFIQYIFRFFETSYGLSSLTNYVQGIILSRYIKYNFTDYKCKNDKLHYSQIIKDICEELNINDFDDAEIDDLRKRVIQKLEYYWKNERIIIKNNKIKITDFGFSIHENWNGTEINLEDSTIKTYSDMASALNYINTGVLEVPELFKKWLKDMGEWQNKKPLDEFYKIHKIFILGVNSLRFYKNRSLEIKFNNEDNKNKFIRILKGDF